MKYQVFSNPTGITFNPISISDTIMSIIKGDSLPEDELFYNGNLWCHSGFHSAFSNPDKKQVLQTLNNQIDSAHSFVKDCEYLIITLGTAFVYSRADDGKVVNNCHKLPQSNYTKRLLTVDDIVETLSSSLNALKEQCKNTVKVIFTLSPVRHIKDGIHENQLSKATCLLAIDQLVNSSDAYNYFPSYEILLDDLRDYRFYAKDLVHPTEQAVDYIFEIFEKSWLDPSEAELRTQISKINSSLSHRAMNPDSDQYKDFRNKLEKQIEVLKENYPFLEF